MNSRTKPLPDSIQKRIVDLPVLPLLVQRLVALDMADEAAYDEVVSIAEEDPVFAARILALANSALLAPTEEIHSLSQAVARVGAWRVGELATAMAMQDLFAEAGEVAEGLFGHSLEVAVAARSLAKLSGVVPGEAYIAGLVHDLGRMVMLAAGGEAAELVARPDELGGADQLMVLLESERLGYDHAEVGALAAEHLGLPSKYVEIIRAHHGAADPRDALLETVQMADALCVFAHITPDAFVGESLVPAAQSVLALVAEPAPLEAAAMVRAIPSILEEAARARAGFGAK